MRETEHQSDRDVREDVRSRYAAAAVAVGRGSSDARLDDALQSRCGGSQAQVDRSFGAAPCTTDDHDDLPAEVVAASLGCGNPTAVAELRAGERVLDLGSGGGIDVLLSARRVGPTGFAYGVDMTDEMLALARANASRAGTANVELPKGTIEDVLPLEGLAGAGFVDVDVELTHEAVPGMHGAVIRAAKPGLPVA